MSTLRTITSRTLRGFRPILARHGLESLPAELGLDLAAEFEPDGVIPFEPFLALMERLAQSLDDDAFGFKFGSAEPEAAVGLNYYIAVSAPNLGEALTRCSLFFGLVSNSFSLSFERDATGGNYTLHFPDPVSKRSQFTDCSIALLVGRIRKQIGSDWNPLYVDFDHPRPRNASAIERILNCPIRFDQPQSMVRIDSAALEKRMAHSDPSLSETLRNLGRQQLGLPKTFSPIVVKLADVVRQSLAEGMLTDELAARRLGVPRRALERQLELAGTSFRDVVDDVRSSMTKHLLSETEIPLTEIAYLLGYSELSAFSRAAKNWLEESPSSYRKRMRTAAN